MSTEVTPRHATLVACNQILGTAYGVTTDLYVFIQALLQQQGEQLDYVMASLDGKPVTTAGQLVLNIDQSIEDVERTDVIMLPAAWGDVDQLIAEAEPLIPWLQKQYEQGAIIVAHATAVFYVAQAGLLDGKAATTHWVYHDVFQKKFPAVNLCRERFITASDRIFCSGNLSAAMDLGIYLVEKFWGEAIAMEADRSFMTGFKRSYPQQFIDFEGQKGHQDEMILKVQEWMEVNYASSVELEKLSERFGLSLRSLKRRFKLATGEPPLQYMQRLRVDRAKELLRQSKLSVNEIAFEVGYDDVSYFSKLFRRHVGDTPGVFRNKGL